MKIFHTLPGQTMNEFNKLNVLQHCLYSYRQRYALSQWSKCCGPSCFHSGQNVLVFLVAVFVFQETVGWRSLTHSILINLFFEPGLHNFLLPPLLRKVLSQRETRNDFIFIFCPSTFAHTMKAGRGIYNCDHVSFRTARSARSKN